MRSKQQPLPKRVVAQKVGSSALLRRLATVLLGLAALALGASAYRWRRQPQLEPLPTVSIDSLEPPTKARIKEATAEVRANQRLATAWGTLGAILRAYEFGAEAEVCFRNAERLDSVDYRWPYLLGVSLAATDGEQALASFRRAAHRCGDKPHVQLRLAEQLIERQLSHEATELVERVLKHDRSNPRGQLAKARLLFIAGDLQEAKSWAESSASGVSDRRAPHLLLAQLCRRTGDSEGEARELAILAQIPDGITPWEDPDVAAVLALRQDQAAEADVLLHAGRFAAAEAALRAELQDSPSDERLHFQLGVACFQQGRFEQAVAEFRRTTELKADHVDAHYNLGHALVKLDAKDQAQTAFAAAVQLRPSHANARINLADLLLQAGETTEAVKHLQVACKLAPQDQRAKELLKQAN